MTMAHSGTLTLRTVCVYMCVCVRVTIQESAWCAEPFIHIHVRQPHAATANGSVSLFVCVLGQLVFCAVCGDYSVYSALSCT